MLKTSLIKFIFINKICISSLYKLCTNFIKSNLTEDFAPVATWFEENQLIVNLKKGKTGCVLFGTSQRTKSKTLDVVHHHRTLSETNLYK